MSWSCLFLAVLFEVAWVLTLPLTQGYSIFWPSLANLLLAVGGMYALSQAMKIIPAVIGYPVWVGISTVLLTLVTSFFFKQHLYWNQYACIALILAGVIGLKSMSY